MRSTTDELDLATAIGSRVQAAPGSDDTTVLVVDDEAPMRRTLSRLLNHHGYRCILAGSAAEAQGALSQQSFELVLSDVNMPGDSGMDLLDVVMTGHRDTAIVMVTAVDDHHLAERALRLGAYGYVIKPFETNEILIAVSNALTRRRLEIENRMHRERLEQMVQERTANLWQALQELTRAEQDVRTSREETVRRLSIAAEFRDSETGLHIKRMSNYCSLLAEALGLDKDECELIRIASAMHDVGKIGVPDRILRKPGRLDPDEVEIMREHTAMGASILSGSGSDLLEMATTIALSHHEWWDGSGYPNGLAGDSISLEARIAAIADVFDSLTSDRVYRRAYPLGQAVDIMLAESGTHFDPELLGRFLDCMGDIIGIMSQSEV